MKTFSFNHAGTQAIQVRGLVIRRGRIQGSLKPLLHHHENTRTLERKLNVTRPLLDDSFFCWEQPRQLAGCQCFYYPSLIKEIQWDQVSHILLIKLTKVRWKLLGRRRCVFWRLTGGSFKHSYQYSFQSCTANYTDYAVLVSKPRQENIIISDIIFLICLTMVKVHFMLVHSSLKRYSLKTAKQLNDQLRAPSEYSSFSI